MTNCPQVTFSFLPRLMANRCLDATCIHCPAVYFRSCPNTCQSDPVFHFHGTNLTPSLGSVSPPPSGNFPLRFRTPWTWSQNRSPSYHFFCSQASTSASSYFLVSHDPPPLFPMNRLAPPISLKTFSLQSQVYLTVFRNGHLPSPLTPRFRLSIIPARYLFRQRPYLAPCVFSPYRGSPPFLSDQMATCQSSIFLLT